MSVELAAALQRLVDEHAEPDEPGLVVGICRDGKLVATATAGHADVERAVPITDTTVFNIASSSKQVCATTLLLLERDGALSLDDPLGKHLTDLRLREPVTVRQCLQHTAGLRDYFALAAIVGAGPDSWKHEHDVIRVLNAQLDTDFAPSTDWSYSNTGYIAAAAVVRAVTGKPLSEVAQQRIFAPLGMTQTRFQDNATALVPDRATGHAKAGQTFSRADRYDEVVGDGAMLTTLGDAALWLAFVADGRVLGKDIRDALLTSTVLLDGEQLPYCLGIEHDSILGRPTVGHGGAIEGYRAHLGVLLDDSALGVIVMANRNDLRPSALARAALGLALKDPGEEPSPTTEVSPDEDVFGLWFDSREMATMSVVRTQNGLALELGSANVDLEPAGRGRWAVPSAGPDVALVRQGDQLILQMGAHHWRQRTMRRIEPASFAEPPFGIYFSRELNAIATITVVDGKAIWRCGAAQPDELKPLSLADHWRAPGGVLTVERSASGAPTRVLINGARMRRVAFEPLDRGAYPPEFPVGFPVQFGGPMA